jgi:hypothetical protein
MVDWLEAIAEHLEVLPATNAVVARRGPDGEDLWRLLEFDGEQPQDRHNHGGHYAQHHDQYFKTVRKTVRVKLVVAWHESHPLRQAQPGDLVP